MNKQVITEMNEGTKLSVFLQHNIALLISKSVVFFLMHFQCVSQDFSREQKIENFLTSINTLLKLKI